MERGPGGHPLDGPLPDVRFNRRSTAPEKATPYYTFGTTPFSFFEDNSISLEDEEPQGFAAGGYPSASYVQGAGGGREDLIPAQLSDGEYVMDAETVALLGDGSAATGAQKLDILRERLRKHKGAALAKGRLSPEARPLESYLS